jgi:hypothetical protein
MGTERFIPLRSRRGGSTVSVGPHPDTPDDVPPADLDLSHVTPVVAALGLAFVPVDLAQRFDGGCYRLVRGWPAVRPKSRQRTS